MGAGPEKDLAALLRVHWQRQLGERADKSTAGRAASVSEDQPAKEPRRAPGPKSMA